ncbi:hypothetical protein SEVIR_7G282466v4 [Setaria viridis]|uniref:Uncharacterized protein n=1 Tax=Setaria viridis TaxID=4556 RepID=A0A4U6TZD0_SETVI|nr:hypothetical protein SEVIR_7G282466v2 [Setaria viridis]
MNSERTLNPTVFSEFFLPLLMKSTADFASCSVGASKSSARPANPAASPPTGSSSRACLRHMGATGGEAAREGGGAPAACGAGGCGVRRLRHARGLRGWRLRKSHLAQKVGNCRNLISAACFGQTKLHFRLPAGHANFNFQEFVQPVDEVGDYYYYFLNHTPYFCAETACSGNDHSTQFFLEYYCSQSHCNCKIQTCSR